MKEVFVNWKLDSWNNYYVEVAQDHLIVFFTISLPINTIFPLSLVYGIMGACLYYVVMHVCISLYMYVFMHACTHISKSKNQIKNILFPQDCDINEHKQ